ncbi:MAG TPA: hypothetical protein VK498_01415 [Ferruginibacter sp.]|nr:hypothetical protein [Ferruginibacter sp.]
MKTKLFFCIALFMTGLTWGQVEKPEIIYIKADAVFGKGTPNATLHIKAVSALPDITNNIPASGDISFRLTGLSTGDNVIIWITLASVDSEKVVYRVLTNQEVIDKLQGPSIPPKFTPEYDTKSTEMAQGIADIEASDLLLKSKKITFKAVILSTNFTVPIIRFDANKPQYNTDGSPTEDSKGTISLFNSIGAGVGIYSGRVTETRDSKGSIIDTDFNNTFGVNVGVLYQATVGDDQRNVFALTGTISVLNFQVGIGYDYGKVAANRERTFVTIAYSIPLYKLVDVGYRYWLTSNTPVKSVQL